MTLSEKETQSYKLGHKRRKNKISRIKGLSIKNKWHVHILGFFMSLDIEVNILFLIIHKVL